MAILYKPCMGSYPAYAPYIIPHTHHTHSLSSPDPAFLPNPGKWLAERKCMLMHLDSSGTSSYRKHRPIYRAYHFPKWSLNVSEGLQPARLRIDRVISRELRLCPSSIVQYQDPVSGRLYTTVLKPLARSTSWAPSLALSFREHPNPPWNKIIPQKKNQYPANSFILNSMRLRLPV